MMLSIFLYTWYFHNFFGWMSAVYSNLWNHFKKLGLKEFFISSWCKSLISYKFCKYFLPVCEQQFCFLNSVFWSVEINFSLILHAYSLRNLCLSQSHTDFILPSSRSFIVLACIFRFIIHFKLCLWFCLRINAFFNTKIHFSRPTHWTEYSFSIELPWEPYFGILYSVPLTYIPIFMPVLYCFDYLSLIVNLEIRHVIFLLLLKILFSKFLFTVINCYYIETQLISVYWSYISWLG